MIISVSLFSYEMLHTEVRVEAPDGRVEQRRGPASAEGRTELQSRSDTGHVSCHSTPAGHPAQTLQPAQSQGQTAVF